jgi:hypothetical protein
MCHAVDVWIDWSLIGIRIDTDVDRWILRVTRCRE